MKYLSCKRLFSQPLAPFDYYVCVSSFKRCGCLKRRILSLKANNLIGGRLKSVTPASCWLSGGHPARRRSIICSNSPGIDAEVAARCRHDSRQDGGVTIYPSFQTASYQIWNSTILQNGAKMGMGSVWEMRLKMDQNWGTCKFLRLSLFVFFGGYVLKPELEPRTNTKKTQNKSKMANLLKIQNDPYQVD